MPGGVPYQPAMFPVGAWILRRPVERVQADRAPWYIGSDAWQMLPSWETLDGAYTVPTGEHVRDSDYGLHCSAYPYTLGCIKVEKVGDIEWLASRVVEALDAGEGAMIVVEA